MSKSDLSKDEFKHRLQNIGMSYNKFSHITGIGLSTIKNWPNVPKYAQVLLEQFEFKFQVDKVLDGIQAFQAIKKLR